MRIESSQLRDMPLAMQEQVAMQLIGKPWVADVIPAVPGQDNLFTISEMAFCNGEMHCKDKVLQILLERKSQVKGDVHEELVQLVEIVRRL
jgi:hypothetical protein